MARGIQLTIDEWFYHWFGEDDNYKAQAILRFFEKLLEVCDKIVIQRGSRLAKKFYALAENSNYYPPANRESVKLLMGNFFRSDKVFIVTEVNEIDEGVTSLLPRKDVYLVQICMETTDKVIITTDTTLYQNLLDTEHSLGIKVFMAENFIQSYPDF